MDRRTIKSVEKRIKKWLGLNRPQLAFILPGTLDRAAEMKRIKAEQPEAIVLDVHVTIFNPDGSTYEMGETIGQEKNSKN